MGTPPSSRSVKIDEDERGGWSSDRPRRDGGTRPANIAVRCRVLAPSEELRYSPASLVVIVSASAEERQRFGERTVTDRGALLSRAKVRDLLSAKLGGDDLESKSRELLEATMRKRLENGEPVAVIADGLDGEERDRYARIANAARRPCHTILIEVGKDQVSENDQAALNDFRRRLDAADLGEEGFVTAMRLGGSSLTEARRIVFELPPRD